MDLHKDVAQYHAGVLEARGSLRIDRTAKEWHIYPLDAPQQTPLDELVGWLASSPATQAEIMRRATEAWQWSESTTRRNLAKLLSEGRVAREDGVDAARYARRS